MNTATADNNGSDRFIFCCGKDFKDDHIPTNQGCQLDLEP